MPRIIAFISSVLLYVTMPAAAGDTSDARNLKFYHTHTFETLEVTYSVATFQARHSLDADGIVGKQTIAAMNVPVEQRVDQLRASLERLRWVFCVMTRCPRSSAIPITWHLKTSG